MSDNKYRVRLRRTCTMVKDVWVYASCEADAKEKALDGTYYMVDFEREISCSKPEAIEVAMEPTEQRLPMCTLLALDIGDGRDMTHQELTYGQFLENNQFEPDERTLIEEQLLDGYSYRGGGGAAPCWRVWVVADSPLTHWRP